jgi:hypothetical protein
MFEYVDWCGLGFNRCGNNSLSFNSAIFFFIQTQKPKKKHFHLVSLLDVWIFLFCSRTYDPLRDNPVCIRS